jgi:hypothetical protein
MACTDVGEVGVVLANDLLDLASIAPLVKALSVPLEYDRSPSAEQLVRSLENMPLMVLSVNPH